MNKVNSLANLGHPDTKGVHVSLFEALENYGMQILALNCQVKGREQDKVLALVTGDIE